VPVIAALEFYDQVAAGESASKTQSAHSGFSATGDETDFFHERNYAADSLRELHFQFGGYAVAGAFLRLIGDGGGYRRIGVAEKHGSPGADEIEELVAVGVVEILALPRSMIRGSPPTERKARTGEFTPPTRTFSASAKISRERRLLRRAEV